MKIIQFTLKDNKVITTLNINGWDQDNNDPKYFYELIRATIGKVTNKVRINILKEYINFRRTNFDSISSFLVRYN